MILGVSNDPEDVVTVNAFPPVIDPLNPHDSVEAFSDEKLSWTETGTLPHDILPIVSFFSSLIITSAICILPTSVCISHYGVNTFQRAFGPPMLLAHHFADYKHVW